MKKILIIFCFISVNLFSQQEILVNTFQDTTQRSPLIGKSDSNDDGFVIVWESTNQVSPSSEGDIVFQKFDQNFNKVGDEVIVNTETNGNQTKPALSVNSMYEFAVAWASFSGIENMYDIYAKIYLNGTAGRDAFLVNTTTINSQTSPSIAFNGIELIVVWESWFQDGSDRGIYGQRFDTTGTKIGDEFLINTTTAYSQARPVVKYFKNNGQFIVIWESWKQDISTPSGYGIYGKIYNEDGSVFKDEFRINTETNDYQWFGDVETLWDNSFVVTWCSWAQDGHDGGIYLQKFDSEGSRVGNELLVNKSTVYYQWLPKVKSASNGNIGVTWSSWKTDGSREGVYFTLFDNSLQKISFENLVNDYTDDYQWEPDFAFNSISNFEEVVLTWASWGQFGVSNDYDIIAKKFQPTSAQGSILRSTYDQISGRSSTGIIVHVTDSTSLTGHQYEVSFDVTSSESAFATIKDINNNEIKVENFPLNSGAGVFYLTKEFDGLAVEIIPNFDLEIDEKLSYFKNISGTNINFSTYEPTSGTVVVAPIDVKLTWANTDTTSTGSYVNIESYGYGVTGSKSVELPFLPWNITDDLPIDVFIIENASSMNDRWDAGEQIIILTPEQYQNSFPNFHAVVNPPKPSGDIIMPGQGDINYVYAKKPLTSDDKFVFTASKSNFTTEVKDKLNMPGKFSLSQNYPNPFNPTSTIEFSLPSSGNVKLIVFDLLGQKVDELVNEVKPSGNYKVLFDGSNLASGVYFYSLSFGKKMISKKMMIMK